MSEGLIVYTAGHSNTPVQHLLEMLTGASIEALVDVRRYPVSRRNPQFNAAALAASLEAAGIDYVHAADLGGRRQPEPGSLNAGLHDAGFRGFADYTATPAFETALTSLLDFVRRKRTAVMCAESLPWRCHRSLIADVLVARGVRVDHLIGPSTRPHTLSPHARVEDGRITYPAML